MRLPVNNLLAPASLLAMGLRIAALIAVIIAASWLAQAMIAATGLTLTPGTAAQMHRLMTWGLALYVVLLALPFVPGAEIGVALLACFGADAALAVYGATVLALMLSFFAGGMLPPGLIVRGLGFLRLRRAADLFAQLAPLSQQARLALVLQGTSRKTVSFVLRHRYVALMLAVNTPGNVVIGGGGGIMMMAGLSRLFSPLRTLCAIAVAVAPVPAFVWFFGA